MTVKLTRDEFIDSIPDKDSVLEPTDQTYLKNLERKEG